MLSNKKGQMMSYLPYLLMGMLLVFIFAIVVLVVSHGGDLVLNELKEPKNFGESVQAVSRMNQIQNLITPAFDQLVFVILVAMIIASLVIAIFTDYHPIALGVFIISIILLVIVSGLLVDSFDQIRSNPELSAKSSEFKMTNLLLDKPLPVIFTIVGVLGVIVLLSKRGRVVGA